MKKAIIIAIIIISVIALGLAFLAVGIIIDPNSPPALRDIFYKNVKELKYELLTVKLKDGYDYDLSGGKYLMCPYCGCCEEGWCDWKCEAAYEANNDSSCGCTGYELSLFDIATFTFSDVIPINEVYHDSIHFNKEDIFPVYAHIAKKLTDKKKLSDHEVLKIANYYKKLKATIETNEMSNHEFIDSLPEMPCLYTDMKTDIEELLYERRLSVKLNMSYVDLFLESCLSCTGTCPLENLCVINVKDDPESRDSLYYVFSDTGHFYFSYSLAYSEDNCTACMSPISNPPPMFSEKTVSELIKQSVKFTDAGKEIPVYKKAD